MKRGLVVRYSPDAPKRRGETLCALRQYRFGMVRSTALAPELEAADAFEFLNPPLFHGDFHVAFSRHAVRHKELKSSR